MGEEINELKSKLVNQLEKMQMNQKHQMEKIAFCLLNSGNGKIEDLANHLFNSPQTESKKISGKNSGLGTRRGSGKINSLLNSGKGSKLNSRKGSLYNETLRSNGTRGEVPNRGAILQAVGQEVIPEVNEGEDEGKKISKKSTSKNNKLK